MAPLEIYYYKGYARGPVILDFDGVLVDASHCWSRVIRAMFARYGYDYNDAHNARLFGHHPTLIGSLLADTLGRPELAATLGAEAMARGLEEVSKGVNRIPGAIDLVYELYGRRALAVASNTPHHVVEQALKRTGMLEAFSFVVGSDDVMYPKPAPDVYVKACELLGSPVGAATAIEDSVPGVRSAHSAGVYVIAVSTQDRVQSAADESYGSLYDPALHARLMMS